MAFENFADLSLFKNYLMNIFDCQTLSFKDIRIKTVNETTYLKKDYQDALKELENESKVFIRGKGSKGSIRDESMVSFDPKIVEEEMNGENKNSQCTFADF